jgi:hypothetical protein
VLTPAEESVEAMNSAHPLPNPRNLKPPPLPKARGLAVVRPQEALEVAEEDLEVTAVGEPPPEVLRVARSDVRELRVPRPPPPRPTVVPRPNEATVKKSGPPPLPATMEPAPAANPAPAASPAPESQPEAIAAMKPRSLVLARTAWFFGVFVTTGAFRWTLERLSDGKAWLTAEWRRAATRAKG